MNKFSIEPSKKLPEEFIKEMEALLKQMEGLSIQDSLRALSQATCFLEEQKLHVLAMNDDRTFAQMVAILAQHPLDGRRFLQCVRELHDCVNEWQRLISLRNKAFNSGDCTANLDRQINAKHKEFLKWRLLFDHLKKYNVVSLEMEDWAHYREKLSHRALLCQVAESYKISQSILEALEQGGDLKIYRYKGHFLLWDPKNNRPFLQDDEPPKEVVEGCMAQMVKSTLETNSLHTQLQNRLTKSLPIPHNENSPV